MVAWPEMAVGLCHRIQVGPDGSLEIGPLILRSVKSSVCKTKGWSVEVRQGPVVNSPVNGRENLLPILVFYKDRVQRLSKKVSTPKGSRT